MRIGDLIRFWDYEGGDGYVSGLVLKIICEADKVGENAVLSALVFYKNYIQLVPAHDEWISGVINESSSG